MSKNLTADAYELYKCLENIGQIREDLERLINSERAYPIRDALIKDEERMYSCLRSDFKYRVKNLPFPSEIVTGNWRIPLTCFAVALNLMDSEIYLDILKDFYIEGGRADSKYISYLIENNVLKELKYPIEGCIVLYFNKERIPQHAGRLIHYDADESKRIVESKMGNHKKIFEHPLWHVPISYGLQIKYYHPVSSEKSEEQFLRYCEEHLQILSSEDYLPLEKGGVL